MKKPYKNLLCTISYLFFSGSIAAQFTRVLRKPKDSVATGNYLFDYQDTKRHFGAMIQSLIIANPRTNIPETFYITFNSHGSGTNLNHVSVSHIFVLLYILKFCIFMKTLPSSCTWKLRASWIRCRHIWRVHLAWRISLRVLRSRINHEAKFIWK